MKYNGAIKKVLVYGETFRGSMPHSIMLSLTKLGYKSIIFDYAKYTSNLNGNLLLRRLGFMMNRYFFKSICTRVNDNFLKLIDSFEPQLIIVVKGFHLQPRVLHKINKKGIVVVNWHVDDPFNQRYITLNSHDNLALYDIHFSSRPHLFLEYEKQGAKKVEYLEFCYDESIFYPIKTDKNKRYDVSFVGNWSKYREQMIKHIAPFFEVHVYGGSWWRASSLKGEKNVYLKNKRADLEEYSRIVSRSKVCLNFLTYENRDQTNLRNFELPACGGFQLCNRTDQLEKIFKKDLEICLFDSKNEMIDKIKFYLKNNIEREKIANAGSELVALEKHNFTSRCSQVLESAESLYL